MSTGKWGLALSLALAAGSLASNAHAAYWTNWVSEENGGPATYCYTWSEGASGFGCSGSYCDNVRVYCDTLPFGDRLDPSTDYWTRYFSEEDSGIGTGYSVGWYPWDGDNFKVCEPTWTAGIMSGVKCSGRYCDSISIECTVPLKSNGTRAYLTNCGWTGWYSEEQGSVTFGYNRFITGVQCSGSYCDNKSYYVCSLQQ
jgi:hypothetical protein